MSGVDYLVDRVSAGPRGPEVLAVFDFDGTVIEGYSAELLFWHQLVRLRIGPRALADVALARLCSDWDEPAVTRFVTRAVQSFRGMPTVTATALGRRLAPRVAERMFPAAWRLVQEHRRAGHRVLVVSSASEHQVRPLAEALGIEHIRCTILEERDGILTGRILGPVVSGWHKERVVRDFAADNGADLARSYAYGNGEDDVAMLDTVGNPCAVGPRSRLRAIANSRGWAVAGFEAGPSAGPVDLARTLAAYGASAITMSVAAGVGRLSTRDRPRTVALAQTLTSEMAMALIDVDLDVRGERYLWESRPAVFIFNHQSSLDFLVVLKLLRERVTAIVKRELRSTPGIGQFLRMSGAIFVDRDDPDRARILTEAVQRLRSGISLAVAPEGTRSLTPRVARFHRGAFLIAMAAGVPVVPIVIHDSGRLMPRGAGAPQAGRVRVTVCEPIDVSSWTAEDLGERVAEVHQTYLRVLEQPEGMPEPSVG